MINAFEAKHGCFRGTELVLLFALVAAGCGGGSTEVESSGRPDGPVTSGGEEVTPEAEERWTEALERFRQSEAEGWNASRCETTAAAFEQAVEVQGGDFAEALYMAGLTSQRCNDQSEAREWFERALSADEDHCKARASMGVYKLEEGDLDEAETLFKRALQGDPRCTEAYVNLAVVQRSRGAGELSEALNNLRRALAIESEYMPAFNEMALLYLQRAEIEESDRWLDLASVVCRQAQLVDADYGPIYNTWGLVSVQKENIIEAVRFFERAARLDPGMFEAHMNFGATTISFRGYQDAQQAYSRAVELRPNSYDAHIGLGAALRGLGQMDQAQREYERAMEINERRPEAYFNLGILSQDFRSGSVEDLERAKGFYEQFLSRAGAEGPFSDAVEAVRRRCAQQGGRRRRGSSACRPGRLQNIATAVDAMRAAAALQGGQ